MSAKNNDQMTKFVEAAWLVAGNGHDAPSRYQDDSLSKLDTSLGREGYWLVCLDAMTAHQYNGVQQLAETIRATTNGHYKDAATQDIVGSLVAGYSKAFHLKIVPPGAHERPQALRSAVNVIALKAN